MKFHKAYPNTLTRSSLACVVLAVIIGCSSPSIKSRRVTDANQLQKGVSYFLPKVLIQIVADQVQSTTNILRTNTIFSVTNTFSDVVTATNSVGTTNHYFSSTAETNTFTAETATASPDRIYSVTINLLTV